MNIKVSYGSRTVPAILIWTLRATALRMFFFRSSGSYEYYSDPVKHLHQQVGLMGKFGLNGGVPWLTDTEGPLCFICKMKLMT